MKKNIDLSIIITCHSEGILIQRTVLSVRRAIQELSPKYSYEIVLHADAPSQETSDYLSLHRSSEILKDIAIYTNHFKDLAASRNFAVSKAKGNYIAFIDADDIMCKNWLRASMDYLTSYEGVAIAHSAVTIEFEGENNYIIRHEESDIATDTLLSVYSNRWNSIIVAPRDLLLEEPYTANSTGYGYEDWHLNCNLISRGVHNALIPETVIFVRRKSASSEWARQVQSSAVLRSNNLLSFDWVRSIEVPAAFKVSTSADIKSAVKQFVKNKPLLHRVVGKTKFIIDSFIPEGKPLHPPKWLMKEWAALNTIEKQIFPTPELLKSVEVYDTISEDHIVAGYFYKKLVDGLKHDHYDYLLFAPWLIKGGADLFTINYANTITRLRPDKKVLVITTCNTESPWKSKLDPNVDFLGFGQITAGSQQKIQQRLVEHLVENSGATHIHIINSELGYDFVKAHENYIRATGKKVIASAFSQSTDKTGRIFGYSHTHVPQIYELASLITSDNQAVVDMWQSDYGFDPGRLAVHRQIFEIPAEPPTLTVHTPLRVLWAARIAPEKMPEILPEIGKLTSRFATIDIYGAIERECAKVLKSLPPNVKYHGTYDGFDTLPTREHDVYLYTSLFDGVPHTLLEATTAGLPIVASAVGGIPEFILNEKTGLLVQDIHSPQAYADALSKLFHELGLSSKLSGAASEKIRKEYSSRQYQSRIHDMLSRVSY